ncbi:4627_t:CDS:2, partial [Funneliformis caledonium]
MKLRCEYISTILYTSLYIVKKITEKEELTLVPQLEVIREESTSWVNYAIKALEELICIMKEKLHQVSENSNNSSSSKLYNASSSFECDEK